MIKIACSYNDPLKNNDEESPAAFAFIAVVVVPIKNMEADKAVLIAFRRSVMIEDDVKSFSAATTELEETYLEFDEAKMVAEKHELEELRKREMSRATEMDKSFFFDSFRNLMKVRHRWFFDTVLKYG